MKYTIEQWPVFKILGISRNFSCCDCKKTIPEFWDEYYKKGNGEIACGQFGYCFNEEKDGSFRYAIGNRCKVGENGVLHIYNRPDREAVPSGFEIVDVPAHTWLKVQCLGPLPQSIQGMYPIIERDWPEGFERLNDCTIEEYGRCECPEDSQKEDYCCYIWVPVQAKDMRIISLRENPEMIDTFFTYFTEHWGNPAVYRDCLESSLVTDSPLPQFYLAVMPDGRIAGCVNLITNDFVSRMDLWPYLGALWVEEDLRKQGIGGKLILHVADEAKRLGFKTVNLCTDHIGFYEKYGFVHIGTGYHPWDDTSRIYQKTLE